ncbi:L-histidine N(alpha)-methyltransferase [Algiphilus sp.]|uniref:L-histidine N(alpha)-methyltransferase n=2 Tax=Algiphilus sp. TaxID=1872431 RepID=UPI0025BF9953|nr:L-histidine N(alpha)-methyltransferase [Algiphilus sp.]MCK5770667.1 L-histidine N(alpha)-methyltransferase [Algiphilus sp.]
MSGGDAAIATESAVADDFAGDVVRGLSQPVKRIPSKYLYDARGSELFEAICEQPEYYPTRTELAILDDHRHAIAAAVGSRPLVLEYGSGSGIKTRLLLDALDDPVAYVPVEISASALDESVADLAVRFPDVEMLPLCADFTRPLRLPVAAREPASVLVFFPGSTLGNFATDDAVALLTVMRGEIGDAGAALVGIDLQKDRATVEAAYNDAAGVTAAFTLNLLARMNRELDADFDPARFHHRARYNALAGRIETHIVSDADQRVSVAGRRFDFGAGEGVLVEYSCKYSHQGFADMAARAGLAVTQSWTDGDERFALQLLRPRGVPA